MVDWQGLKSAAITCLIMTVDSTKKVSFDLRGLRKTFPISAYFSFTIKFTQVT
jgi:hypothetical protein